jgi:multidrug resistance efflux pump
VNQRSKIFILLGVLLVIALAYYFFSVDHSTDMVLIGTVDANQVVVSPKIAGRIIQLPLEEGMDVKSGDLVATIDNDELTAARDAAQAQAASLRSQLGASRSTSLSTTGDTTNVVANAKANVSAAKSALQEAIAQRDLQQADTKRIVALAQQGVASQQDSDRAANALRAAEARVQSAQDQAVAAQAALASAQARTNQAAAAEQNVSSARGQLAAAQAQVSQAETRLGYTRVVSPISGKVSVRVARPGEVLNPGQAIVTIVDLTQTWVYAPMPETNSDAVQIGDTLKVRMPSGATVDGKVIAKSAEADFATQRDVSRTKRDVRTVQLKLLIPNEGMRYVPGMTASVLIPKSKLVSK